MIARIIVYGGLTLLIAALVTIGTNPIWPVSPITNSRSVADAKHLQSIVNFLSTMHPSRQASNAAALDAAGDYISNQFKIAGLTPYYQTYERHGRKFKNVIVSLGPQQAAHLVIGAHYDVYGENPGADDNASGVAGLIELARLLSARTDHLQHAVDLVAYTLEEPPAFATEAMGSYVHAQSLVKDHVPVIAMISIEMIGFFSDKRGTQAYPLRAFDLIYPNQGNFIALVGRTNEWTTIRWMKKAFRGATDIELKTANVPAWVPALDFSDHRNYWASGFPAVMLTDTAFYRNKNYHEAQDSAEKLDYDRMAKVVDGLVGIALQ